MAEPKITVSTQFDLPTLKLGSAMHLRNRHPVFTTARYLYLLLVPVGIGFLVAGERLPGFLCLLIGPILFMRKIFWQFRLIQRGQASAQADQRLRWTFSELEVEQKAKGYGRSFKWEEFGDRFLSPKGILLYLEQDQYFILPRSAFGSEEDFLTVTRLCEEKVQGA